MSTTNAWIDLAAGVAVLGSLKLPIRLEGPGGDLRVGSERGPLLRPLRFGERSRAVLHASMAPDPILALSAEILALSILQTGEGDVHGDPAFQIVALLLACGGHPADRTAIPFAEAALLVGHSGGWQLSQIEEADAMWVDHLAASLGQTESNVPTDDQASSQEPKTILLFSTKPTSELDELRRTLAEGLLARGRLRHDTPQRLWPDSIDSTPDTMVVPKPGPGQPFDLLDGRPPQRSFEPGSVEQWSEQQGDASLEVEPGAGSAEFRLVNTPSDLDKESALPAGLDGMPVPGKAQFDSQAILQEGGLAAFPPTSLAADLPSSLEPTTPGPDDPGSPPRGSLREIGLSAEYFGRTSKPIEPEWQAPPTRHPESDSFSQATPGGSGVSLASIGIPNQLFPEMLALDSGQPNATSPTLSDLETLADALAERLQDESDLRGLEP